jgi:hypothetical protein
MPIDPRDKLDISNTETNSEGNPSTYGSSKPSESNCKFLSVLFRCCNTYGRLYVNGARSHYEGRCPKCGSRTRARIGRGGTDQRIFETG